VKLTFLGTGTSHGVPVIGCSCAVCSSTDPRNARLRCSVLIEDGGTTIVVDTGPEFRIQALRAGLKRLDAVVLTHAHADHLHGLDDVRPLTRDQPASLYASEAVLTETRNRFPYVFQGSQGGGGIPRLALTPISGPFTVNSITVTPLPVLHGTLPILGFRFGPIAYITDCSSVPDETWPLLEGLDILVLNALRHLPHPTHLSVNEALQLIGRIRPRRAYLTHFCHDIDHRTLLRELHQRRRAGELTVPTEPAYDTLVVESQVEQ